MTRTLRAIGAADTTGQGLLAVALALVVVNVYAGEWGTALVALALVFCELQLLVVKYEK